MPIPVGFLLAAQAGGMILDWIGTSAQNEAAARAARLQQQAIEISIATSRLQTEDESLRELVQLRQNLGTQAAVLAARGVRAGTGVGVIAAAESQGAFNADERMRRINQMMNEKRLKAGLEISKIQQKTFENNNWNSFLSRTINRIPTSPDFYKQLGSSFGLTPAS
jgi:hypothetical protein